MCRNCRRIVSARVFFRDGAVWQQSLCPDCENREALIASDKDWYMSSTLKAMPDHSPLHGAPPQSGCPFDCGPCTWHASPCQLPVISVTNACNLRCPICFTYNRSDRIYHMSVDEMNRTVDWIIESSGAVDVINITGGEPTLHPEILGLLTACRHPQIGRITMNSNGLRLAEDYALCEQLADLGVCVILSLNTFDDAVSVQLHGRDVVESKLRALDNLRRAGVRMTLLHVMVGGLNADDMPQVLKLLRDEDQILSLTVQTMTYTGQGGGAFGPVRHIPVDLAAKTICAASEGAVAFDDFVTRPSAHPLCYLICYLLRTESGLVPLGRFTTREKLESLIRNSYLIRPDAGEEFFQDLINQLYAEGRTEYLAPLRELVERVYPPGTVLTDFQRQRAAESAVKTIYVHAHMDEDTFDCSRAMSCPDLVPSEPGRLVPACTYNLFYRMRDSRFYVQEEQ